VGDGAVYYRNMECKVWSAGVKCRVWVWGCSLECGCEFWYRV
jgi:hypothetical protein